MNPDGALGVDELQARAHVHQLADELGIESARLRGELLADAERAVEILEHALRAPRIRNRAAFAIARWRDSSSRPQPEAPAHKEAAPAPDVEASTLEVRPPSLAALEYAWSREPTLLTVAMLDALAAAIGRAGGFRAVDV